MKLAILFLVLFFNYSLFSQEKKTDCNPTILLDNFSSGDTITMDEFINIKKILIDGTICDAKYTYEIIDCIITAKSSSKLVSFRNVGSFFLKNSIFKYSSFKSQFKITIDEVKAIRNDGKAYSFGNTIFTIVINPRTKNHHNEQIQNIKAKLIYGSKKNTPLSNYKIYLTNSTGDTIKNTVTNEFGDFEFIQVNIKNTNLVIPIGEKIKNEKEIYLAKQSGIIITKINKTKDGFSYKILEGDIIKLEGIVEEDSGLKLDAFNKSTSKELLLVENIYYATDDYKVSDKTAKLLTKIAETMKTNASLKLEVSSHTDAKGADAYNKDLSDKRAKAVMEFLISKGIAKTRIKAIGMGETKVLNRCKNDINCSEKEHELNRRTEFKFSK